ncbi:AAA family ATPase [Streptomyces sp. J2-1]|uniref:ATP-binding protein n=1 Tax=Streptomyces corallincola TaxID=2851888 RepID=UPI001C387DEC|nr:AAA family ATPase [Streptomyces corallincola]MBV2355344.1 AAA family ATPase [Streptomyces corallincola]
MTEERPGGDGSATLWERDTEIEVAKRALDALREEGSATGGLIVFRAEAGLGKTALLAEIRRVAEARNCTVWSARGAETLRSVPFNTLRQLLQPALVSLSPDEARAYLGDSYDIAGPALGIADPGEGTTADPRYVIDGLVSVVRRLATRDWPLVLLLDDAHWADQETLGWLAAFVEHLDDLSVLVVLARRPGGVDGDSARLLDKVTDASAGPVHVFSALTPDGVAGLTRHIVGPHADDAFCREVWAVTAGSPYETVELLTKVRDGGLRPVEAQAAELRELNRGAKGGGLMDRLHELGVEAVAFAQAAVILGTGIRVDMAATLAGLDLDTALRTVQLLQDERILTASQPAATAPGAEPAERTLEFVHPLIAGTIFDAISRARRTALHGAAARLVTVMDLGIVEVSRHLLEVHPEGDDNVVEQMREAAREHLAVGAPDAARRCLERALREPPRPEAEPHVLYELGRAAHLTEPGVTVQHLQHALSLPGLDCDRRVNAVITLSQVLLHNNQLEEAVRTVEAEVARHEPGPVRLRLQAVQFMWESIHGESGSPERSRRLAELAAAGTGRDNSERALLILRGFDLMTHGESAEEVAQLCDRALVNNRLAPGLGWTDDEWGIELLMMLGSAYTYTDRLYRAESLFQEALRAYTGAGWSGGHLSLANAYLGLAYRRQGKLADAEVVLREALRLAERVGRGLPLYWSATCGLVDTLLARGHVEEAWSLAERYQFAPPYPTTIVLPDIRSVRGRLLLAVGRVEEGVDELQAAEKTALARGGHNPVLAPWAIDLAKALAPREPARAAQLATDARRQAERFGTDTAIGEALRCQAALATGREAVRLAEQAVAYLELSPCQYEHAAARVEYGIATRSVSELERGEELARQCAADGLAAHAREALRTVRGLH